MAADICIIAEGSYPYVRGGVSSWIHDLIISQPQHTFHIAEIVPENMELVSYYEYPDNVIGSTVIPIRWRSDKNNKKNPRFNYNLLKDCVQRLCFGKASLDDFSNLLELIAGNPSFSDLIESKKVWKHLLSIYHETMPESSFLDYFWSMRALLGGIYSILLAPLPQAKIYHATCTGYAGLLAARAKIETGRPALITEHGIYTNERRIEIASAEWLMNYQLSANLTVDKLRHELKDLWMDAFAGYSRIAYEACNPIITLYEDNQNMQVRDGAKSENLRIIPNGIDIRRFSRIAELKGKGSGDIAFIGRVVPVKDVKSYIRIVKELHDSLPFMKAYIIGPYDEDPDYYHECLELVRYLALEETVIFTGQVNLEQYLHNVDVIVLTSISEAQPLVVLEAGAAAIPVVATDVGACREIILGKKDEDPQMGPGGYVVSPFDTASMIKVIHRLLTDEKRRRIYGRNLHKRTSFYYTKEKQDKAYLELYEEMLAWRE